MSASFQISPATSIGFRYETGTGTICQGETLPDNFLNEDISEYYNCPGVQPLDYCQPYECTDSMAWYFFWDIDTIRRDPVVIMEDENGNPIASWDSTTVGYDLAGNMYRVAVDWSDYPAACNQCVRFYVLSYDSTANVFTAGDNGTMEANVLGIATAPGNTRTQSNAENHTPAGTYSCLVTASASPSSGDEVIARNSGAMTFEEECTIRVSAWIYVPTARAWNADEFIRIIPYGLSDAVVLSSVVYDCVSGDRDSWVQIVSYIKIGSDTSGGIAVVSDVIPDADGVIYVDDIEVSQCMVVEATSEPVCVQSDITCSTLIKYIADLPSSGTYTEFGINYNAGTTTPNAIRVQMKRWPIRMADPDFVVKDDSANTADVQKSFQTKIYSCTTQLLPPYMVEKLSIALKHDVVTFDGVEMVCLTKDISPDWPEGNSIAGGVVKFEMRPKDYNYQNNACV